MATTGPTVCRQDFGGLAKKLSKKRLRRRIEGEFATLNPWIGGLKHEHGADELEEQGSHFELLERLIQFGLTPADGAGSSERSSAWLITRAGQNGPYAPRILILSR
jgi:hypothetical protein